MIFSFVLGTCCLLLICSLFFYWAIKEAVSVSTSDDLNGRIKLYQAIIAEQADPLSFIKKEMEWQDLFYEVFPHFFVRVNDPSGTTLVETAGMADLLPPTWFPPPSRDGRLLPGYLVRKAANHRFYQLNSVRGDGHGHSFTIQVGMDRTIEEDLLAHNYRRMAMFSLAVVLCAIGVARMISLRVLAPLLKITVVASRVNVETISERIAADRWPAELMALAGAFNGMLQRLEDSFDRLSQYASNMAHEIRTPINNLLGAAEVALAQERSPEGYRQVLESAVEECTRLSRLVNTLLFLARAANPATRINRSLIDPVEEVETVFGLLGPMAEEHGAHLACHGGGLVYADPSLFRRAVINLLTNALHYAPPNVTVDVAVNRTSSDFIEVIVSDTGYGIDEKDLKQIFDRFYRVDSSHANYPQGTGLGLSIVQAIMNLHGGSVTISSNPGQGTTVTLRFPAHAPPKQYLEADE